MQARPMMHRRGAWPSCGLPVWAVPAQASRAEGDEPIVTLDAGSHVRPVGSACVCDPTSLSRAHVDNGGHRRDAKPWSTLGR